MNPRRPSYLLALVLATALAAPAMAQPTVPQPAPAVSAPTPDASEPTPAASAGSGREVNGGEAAKDEAREGELRETVEVSGRADELVGLADSATEGVVGRLDLAQRPFLRPGEILETIPGVIITQHSGGGKANQYFLRGFNLDHGTDFRITVGGVPVNLPTHAHGQGYSDLNFLIPELVQSVDYRKGPYSAQDGDFSAAGSARIDLVRSLPHGLVQLSGGSFAYGRALVADSARLGGGDLLGAIEAAGYDGPWQRGDDLRRWNGLVRWSRGDLANGVSVTAMGYDGSWDATDQIPRWAVRDGVVDRFGGVDPTTGGTSRRTSVEAEVRRGDDTSLLRASVFVLDYHLDLFSNFTYFLDDPEHGDQFEQKDDRTSAGFTVARDRLGSLFGRAVTTTLGADLRADWIDNGLFHTEARRRLATRRTDQVTQLVGGPWAEARVAWTSWLRTTGGLRLDGYWTDVASNLEENSGRQHAALLSPKLGVVVGPWKNSELYLDAGLGFHSNDARGTTIRVDPQTGEPLARVDPLVRATAVDLGLRTIPLDGLQSTASIFLLDLDSELLFVGDAGTTEANRPSRRTGVELANFWQPSDHVRVDLDLAYTRARFRDPAPEGDHIPGAVEGVVSAGVALEDLGPWSGALRARFFGPRPLIEDDSVRSASSTLVYAQAGYTFGNGLRLGLEVFNLLDARVSDIDYFYTSRLRPTDEPRDDVHFHPAEGRSLRLVAEWRLGR